LKVTTQPDMISFAGGLPAPELFPTREIEEACDRVLRQQGKRALQYGETEGVSELRDWIAHCASSECEGIILRRENVIIVSGAQQGLDLIGRVLLDADDKVIVENPTYLALLLAWRPLGVEFLAAPSDTAGMRVEEVEPILRQGPKLVYCVPNFHNPTGTTLSLERRQRLVELARQSGAPVVEDDAYGELRFQGAALPSLYAIGSRMDEANANPVIRVGTFSKIIAPGLRVGWIIAPADIIERLGCAKQALDLHTSTLNQLVIYELLREQFLDRHVPRLRQAYEERRDAMLTSLESNFATEATWTRPEGGMFLMLKLLAEIDTTHLLRRALPHKVAFVPGAEFHLKGEGTNTLRLNFSNAKPNTIEEGVRRLASALRDLLAMKLPPFEQPHRS